MSTNYFLISCVVVLSFFHHSGDATRFLPMVVWDHTNPILKCKCNWLTIPKFDIYDKLDFVCPSLAINVDLMDGYSRPTAEMNVNIFRRKVTSFQNLTKSLMDGSFCDPAVSVKLYSCLNGEEGRSFPVTFKPEDDMRVDYKVGDIFVFFNNGDDGKSATLNSMAKKCSMVFIVNVTWVEKQKNDMAYGKHLNPKDSCNNGSVPCTYECRKPKVKPPINPSSTYSTSNPSCVQTSPTTESPTTTQCVVTTTQVVTATQVATTQVVTATQVATTPTSRPSTTPTSRQVFQCSSKLICTQGESKDRIFICNTNSLLCKKENFTNASKSKCDSGSNEAQTNAPVYLYCISLSVLHQFVILEDKYKSQASARTGKRSSDNSDLFLILFVTTLAVTVILVVFIVVLWSKNTSKKESVREKSFQNEVCVSTSDNFTTIQIVSIDEKTIQRNGVNNPGYDTSPNNDDEPKIGDCNTKDTKPFKEILSKDNLDNTGVDNGGYSSSLERDEKKDPAIPPKDKLDDVDGYEKDDTYEREKEAYILSPERNEKGDPAIPPKYILDVDDGYEIMDKYKKDPDGMAIDTTI